MPHREGRSDIISLVRLASQHGLISVRPVKVHRQRLLRTYLHPFGSTPCLTEFVCREAQAKRGEEAEVDPEQFQDPDNEYGLFAGTTYEADDEEADLIYEQVDKNMDARRRARRYVAHLPHFPPSFFFFSLSSFMVDLAQIFSDTLFVVSTIPPSSRIAL